MATASPAGEVEVIEANRAAVVLRRPIPTIPSPQILAPLAIFRLHLHLSLLLAFPHLHFSLKTPTYSSIFIFPGKIVAQQQKPSLMLFECHENTSTDLRYHPSPPAAFVPYAGVEFGPWNSPPHCIFHEKNWAQIFFRVSKKSPSNQGIKRIREEMNS